MLRPFRHRLVLALVVLAGAGAAPQGATAAFYASLDAGLDHTCAIRPGGSVYCWGNGLKGQLGIIGMERARTPMAVIGSYTALQVSSGAGYWCELLSGGKVSCTGSNVNGQLGTGNVLPAQYPQDVIGLAPATRIEVGHATSCAITTDGLYCWGDGVGGQFGTFDLIIKPAPTPQPQKVPNTGRVIDVSVGLEHVCAVREDRRILCWGDTTDGKLGTPRASAYADPGDLVTGITDAVAVAAGERHTCALRQSKTVWCWGNNEFGQLGAGPSDATNVPIQVQGLTDVTQVGTQANTTCALRADGTVWCWGDGLLGQLGNGARIQSALPQQVQGISDAMVLTVGAGHACAATHRLAPYCWGSNREAQLGSGGLIGPTGVEPTARAVQDAVRGSAEFLPTPLAERGRTSRGGQVYLRVLHLRRRGDQCPTAAAVTIRARGREVVRTATDLERTERDCLVTGLLNLPSRTAGAFTVVVVVRGKGLVTRKVTLKAARS